MRNSLRVPVKASRVSCRHPQSRRWTSHRTCGKGLSAFLEVTTTTRQEPCRLACDDASPYHHRVMTSGLQQRGESAAKRFNGARKPIVVEFAGSPKAGKTSTINQIQTFLKRCKFKVQVVVERASICPIRDKQHPNFNVWTACTTLAQILERTQMPSRPEDPHILILDRGLFDAVSWLAVMRRLERIREKDRSAVEKFLLADDWRKRVTGVIVMTVSPADSMAREMGLLPVQGSTGSIMNEPVLTQMLATTRQTAERLNKMFRIFEVDTSGNDKEGPRKTAERVASIVLDLIEEQLEEEILFLPAADVAGVFAGASAIDADQAKSLVGIFADRGRFMGREAVEGNDGLVQALPVVVVRNRTGHVLRLRRKEQRADDLLHQKVVIWAGGHVRREDGTNGSSILRGAVRELQEELRLSIDITQLRLLGAIHLRNESRRHTQQHAAIVYEWRAHFDDVAVALSSVEFFERRGNSVSGSFVSVDDLARDIDNGTISEPWSAEIIRRMLPEVNGRLSKPKLL